MAEEIKSNRGLADILGVNESSIRRAEEKGRIAIKRDDEGNIDVEDAKKRINELAQKIVKYCDHYKTR